MTIPEPLILYTRSDCHLCDLVITMLESNHINWRPVDIDEEVALAQEYGARVPVMKRPDTGQELCYPFDAKDVLEFARANP